MYIGPFIALSFQLGVRRSARRSARLAAMQLTWDKIAAAEAKEEAKGRDGKGGAPQPKKYKEFKF